MTSPQAPDTPPAQVDEDGEAVPGAASAEVETRAASTGAGRVALADGAKPDGEVAT